MQKYTCMKKILESSTKVAAERWKQEKETLVVNKHREKRVGVWVQPSCQAAKKISLQKNIVESRVSTAIICIINYPIKSHWTCKERVKFNLYSRKEKKSMETNPKNTQMMHLADKDFKVVTINMFKELKEIYT